jgi:hypothetical protein
MTNATSASDLSGPFNNFNLNVAYGFGFSIQFGVSGGTFFLGLTTDPGLGASASIYHTARVIRAN